MSSMRGEFLSFTGFYIFGLLYKKMDFQTKVSHMQYNKNIKYNIQRPVMKERIFLVYASIHQRDVFITIKRRKIVARRTCANY